MRRFVQAFFRHPVLLILPILIAPVVSLLYSSRAPKVYTASMSLWCDTPVPNPSSIFTSDNAPATGQQSILTELLSTRTFLTKVAEAGPWKASIAGKPQAAVDSVIWNLGAHVGVHTTGRHILVISTVGPDPTFARDLAKAVGDAYVADVNETQQARAKSSLGFYDVQAGEAAKALAEAQSKLNEYVASHQGAGPLGVVGDVQASQLSQDVSSAKAQYEEATLNASTARLGLTNVSDSGLLRIYDEARAADAPVSRKKQIVFGGVAGLFGGAMVSFMALLLLVLADQSVRGAGDIESIPGMEVVGTVEQFRMRRRRGFRAS
ncbi:MAG TPA: hypothetical protein VFJ85_00070 [Acidimicrobiales bacterium]|nr:hypothetical protein [Acidimicrobiales bacterium]